MSNEYIEKHLAKFDNGAARFTTKKKLDTYGPAHTDLKTFVMPSAEADALLATANGDKRTIEKALGLASGELDGDVLVRIDENSANEFWLPGGLLPDGNHEAVVKIGNVSLGPDGWIFKSINL